MLFAMLGIPDTAHGVAWPSIRHDLGQPLAALGLVSVAITTGYVSAGVVAGRVGRRIGTGRLLTLVTGLLAVALATVAAAPVWPALLVGMLALGVAGGGIDAGVQAHATRRHGMRTMGALHAGYGVGAAMGPLLVTAVLGSGLSWRAAYGSAAVAAAALAVVVGVLAPSAWGGVVPSISDAAAAPTVTLGPDRAVLLGAALFFLVTGLEGAVAAWSYVFLTAGRGVAGTAAGVLVGAGFALQTTVRVVLALVGHRIGPRRLLAACCAMSVAGALLLLPGSAPLGVLALLVANLGIGGLYPVLMAMTGERLGGGSVDAAVGYQVGAAAAGATVLIGITGVVLGRAGPGTLPVVVVPLALAVTAAAAAGHPPRRRS